MATPILSVAALRQQLLPLLREFPGGAVVFDADGTLWSHDVGCMVFDFAIEQGLFRQEVCEALRAAARAQGVDVGGFRGANDLARRIQAAWYSGRTAERPTAEVQVWAYAGFEEDDFRCMVRDALRWGNHEATLHHAVLAMAHWVRSNGGRAYIVSASPLWVVEEATCAFGFTPHEIAAGVPNLRTESEGRIIAPGLAEPLPYGPDKVVAGKKLLGARPWLATLGDSSFDIDMMRCARLAAGIGHKPEMLTELGELEHGVRLDLALWD